MKTVLSLVLLAALASRSNAVSPQEQPAPHSQKQLAPPPKRSIAPPPQPKAIPPVHPPAAPHQTPHQQSPRKTLQETPRLQPPTVQTPKRLDSSNGGLFSGVALNSLDYSTFINVTDLGNDYVTVYFTEDCYAVMTREEFKRWVITHRAKLSKLPIRSGEAGNAKTIVNPFCE